MSANVASDDSKFRTVKATNRATGKVMTFRVRKDATMEEVSRMYAKHMGLGHGGKVEGHPEEAPTAQNSSAPPSEAPPSEAPPSEKEAAAASPAAAPARRATEAAAPAAATPPRHDAEVLRSSSTRHLIDTTPKKPAARSDAATSPACAAFGAVVEPTVADASTSGGAGEVTLYKKGFRQGISLDAAYRPGPESSANDDGEEGS